MILITSEEGESAGTYDTFLAFAVANTKDTLRFAHIYSNRQWEFTHVLQTGDEKFQGIFPAVSVLGFVKPSLLGSYFSNVSSPHPMCSG